MTEVIRCANCGANNRVDTARLGEAICGRCRQPLRAAGEGVKVVTDETFGAEVEKSGMPVLVDVWAPWCGPCRMIAPVIEKLAGEMAGRVKFAKLNSDENPETARRFMVESLPTLLVFKGGQEVERLVGLMPLEQIRRKLEQVVA